jgi:CheY-like chemotaxis protein
MGGFEAARNIWAADSEVRNSRMPVVALMANAMREDREPVILAGMDDYVAKPIRKEELRQTIDRWLKCEVVQA